MSISPQFQRLTNADIARLLRITADRIEHSRDQMHVHHYVEEYRASREDPFDGIPGHPSLRHQVISNDMVRFEITVDEEMPR